MWNRQDFDELIEASEAAFRSPQNIRHRFDPKSLQMDVTTEITYQQRKIDVERKSSDYRASTSKKTRELRAKISSLRTTKFNELIRINAEETEELFEAFGENGDLMRFLVLEGFLDNNYYQYTSLFHSGRLSPSDNKFLNQIRSYINPEPDSQIDNPKEVIAAMREDDFRQNFVLNKTLVDCMFSSQGEYNTQIAKMTEFVASNFAECGEFFSTYYQSGVCVTELVSTLNVKWRGFVSAAIASSDNVLHVAQMIGHLPDAQLKALHTRDPSVSDFISENLSEILALGIDFEPRRLELIQFEIEDLGSVGAYPAIAQLLADSGKFQISVDNIEFVFREILRSPATEDLQTKHYSTVLRSEDQGLINKIHGNFALYLKVVLLGSGNNTEEEISAIIAVINHDEIETEYLVEFVASQSAKLPSLEQVPTRLHSALFRLQKIAPSWENCLAYRESEEFDAATLTEFLERGDTLSALSPIKIDGQNAAAELRSFLFNNNDFEDETYRAYVITLPRQFKQFPEGVELEKLRILIEENTIIFSDKSFSFLEGKEDLQMLFVASNIGGYFADEEKFSLDDEFREQLLHSDIDDKWKLKLIAQMDLTALAGLPDRASIVGEVLHRTNRDISNLDAEIAQTVIINSKPTSTQISLFNRWQNVLSDEQVWATIQQLAQPFSRIELGYSQPTIPNTPENAQFVAWLGSRRFISSSRVTLLDEIRINNRRK